MQPVPRARKKKQPGSSAGKKQPVPSAGNIMQQVLREEKKQQVPSASKHATWAGRYVECRGGKRWQKPSPDRTTTLSSIKVQRCMSGKVNPGPKKKTNKKQKTKNEKTDSRTQRILPSPEPPLSLYGGQEKASELGFATHWPVGWNENFHNSAKQRSGLKL